MNNTLDVGKIVNTHGVRGEVRVIANTDFPEKRFAPGTQLLTSDGKTELTVASHRRHKQFDLLTFEGYEDLDSVESLKNETLFVRKEELHDLDEGEFYYFEVIGSQVVTVDGDVVGEVTSIMSPGANDVWVVKKQGSQDELLIPYIDDVVKGVDIDAKKVVIEMIEGLDE
ncbi:ribosome maturation factor RimM [Texcoconibacillus texcoconensis]|uniref:Ribosome maturation factor RimM n=1 Tax=Texcoconibacillus texcoconensis TaxID=1095777 RepID=A0A840QL66_9BACI|nr:ribosome maturation factor RimM [Texcoconibacillus texcoconensis]MBB5172101.1 16S rRNA processing protein RimM [Texcoconibacillus texcoconensis]